MNLRPPAVAGMFYPSEAPALRQVVRSFLDQAPKPQADAGWPKALIAPHAGYVYSGATAAHAYTTLRNGRGTIRRVVLLGPVHRVPVKGLALPAATAFSTPLGTIALDGEGARAISTMPQVVVSDLAHAHEHSLEVHLPFLQEQLGEFSLLPLAVGHATPQQVAEVLDAVWGGPETLILVSSDLSHFHSYDAARSLDAHTLSLVLQGRPELNHQQACGATPVNGLLVAAARRGLRPRLLAACNSGDTAGDRHRVVGYASVAFDLQGSAAEAQQQEDVPAEAGSLLLQQARHAIGAALGVALHTPSHGNHDWLRAPRATFVTLTLDGRLRGCIGSLEPCRALLDDVRSNAVAAALHDPRFPPLSMGEFTQVRVELSVLGSPAPLPAASEEEVLAQLRPGVDGLVLSWAGRRATFLPQVWQQLPQPTDFLAHLKRKAGLPSDFWDPAVKLQRYTVTKWSEAAPGEAK